MQVTSTNISEHFLAGGGEMGALTRAKDWSNTSLGEISQWPKSLLSTVSLLLSSRFPMFLWWGPNLIQFYNDSYRPSLGNQGKHPTALGQYGAECWPEIWTVIKPLIDQVLAGGESVLMQDQLIPIYRNGKLEDVYWTFSYSAVRDDLGKINGVLVVCNETTTTVINEQIAKLEEKKFRDTVRQAPTAISILRGPHFIVETANDKMLELWGKTAEQVISKKMFDAVPEAAKQGFEERLHTVYTTSRPYIGNDVPVQLDRDGHLETRYVNFIFQPLKDDGIVTGVTAVAVDVTKQVHAKNELIRSENKFRSLIVESPVAMAILKGEDFFIDIANQSILSIWGKTLNEVQGKKLLAVFPELNEQKISTLLKSVFATGIPYREKEASTYVNSFDGKRHFFLDFEYRPLTDADGNISGIIITLIDVTDRVTARQQINDSAERLMLATEGAQLATWDINLKTAEIVHSSRFASIFGMPTDLALTPIQIRERIHPEDIPNVEQAFKNAKATGSYYCELRLLLPDNNVRRIRTQGKIIYEEAVPARMLGTMTDISEEWETERKVAWLASIVHSSEDAIISKSLDGIITSWNDAAYRIFGYTAPEMIGQPISKIIPEDRMGEERDIISRIKRGERMHHFETKRLAKDGHLVDISLTISPIKDNRGNVVGSSKIARDITVQKEAEQLLKRSREQLQIVIDASELGTWDLSLITKEFTYSKRYLEILGYTDTTVRPTHGELSKHLHPDDVRIRQVAFEEAYEKGILLYTARIIWNDGSIHWVEIKGKVFYDEKNKPEKIIGTARDITEQRSYQHVLEESEQKFRLLADSMPQFVWIGNEAGILHYFNQSVYDYTGFSPDQVEKVGWLQIVHPDDREENIKLWMRSVKTGEAFSIEHRLKRSDGEYRWQVSKAVPQKDAEGKIQMWVGTSTDIHDRKIFTQELEKEVHQRTKELKQLNEDLIKSNDELAQFAYVASHDLQEPLRKIQTFSARLLESESQNLSEKGKDYFMRMQLASKRMQQLILDLLSYSRANTAEKHFENANLHVLLQVVKEQLREVIDQKHALIKSSNLPTANVIPYQLEQLLTNILSNALKFSKQNERPVIEVSADIVKSHEVKNASASADEYHRIVIKDNGIGFDAQYSERIFQVFQRLHGKDEFPGTGIGLAIVKKIAENHNGIITATGELNKGAIFTLYLPV